MLSVQSKVEWMGEPKEQVGRKTFYSEVLISGNRVSSHSIKPHTLNPHISISPCMYVCYGGEGIRIHVRS